jgi:hypothetical protein
MAEETVHRHSPPEAKVALFRSRREVEEIVRDAEDRGRLGVGGDPHDGLARVSVES